MKRADERGRQSFLRGGGGKRKKGGVLRGEGRATYRTYAKSMQKSCRFRLVLQCTVGKVLKGQRVKR